MNANQQTHAFLHRAVLSAMLLRVAPAAFADLPGYLFKEIEPNTQAVASILQQPQHATAGSAARSTLKRMTSAQSSGSMPRPMRLASPTWGGSRRNRTWRKSH